jgi:3-isopropylmalate/(R)-2-methylmalate dehydratase small subunit
VPDLSSLEPGRVWKFGDSISTNQIGGGRGGAPPGSDRLAAMKANCLKAVRPEFSEQVQAGDILVAGANFGNGSSSPGAAESLQACGLQAIVADSISRLMMRTLIAKGLPAFAVPGVSEIVEDGEELAIDYTAGVARNPRTGRQVSLRRFPPTVEQIYAAGGIVPVIGRRLAAEGVLPPAPP